MFYFVLTVHLLLCFILVVLVLLQQGKGASAGPIFSGSSNTLFGAAGANTVLVKVTTGCAIAFFVTSILLVRLYTSNASSRAAASSAVAADPLAGSVMQGLAAPSAPATAEAPDAAAGNAPATNIDVAPTDAASAAESAASAAAPVAAAAAAKAVAPTNSTDAKSKSQPSQKNVKSDTKGKSATEKK